MRSYSRSDAIFIYRLKAYHDERNVKKKACASVYCYLIDMQRMSPVRVPSIKALCHSVRAL